MSAQTDFRQILTGAEQANQAVVWDWFATNSDPIEGRVAPSGQTWAVIAGGENKAQTTAATMRLKAGSETATVYPYIVSPVALTVIGAELEFIAAGGATHYAEAVLIISQSTNLATGAFLHFVFSSSGYMRLDWFATGLNGGITSTTGPITGTINNGERITIQGLVEHNGIDHTATFVTNIGVGRLTGLTLPSNMVTGMWEFTNNGADLRNSLRYHKAWANPTSAVMLGQGIQPQSETLSRLSRGALVLLPNIVLTTPIIGNAGTPIAAIAYGSATLVNGTVTVANANAWAQSRIFVNRRTDGGTIGCSYTITTSDFVSLTITSKTSAGATQTLDTSVVSWLLFNA